MFLCHFFFRLRMNLVYAKVVIHHTSTYLFLLFLTQQEQRTFLYMNWLYLRGFMGEGEKVFFDILFYVAKNGCVTAAVF